MSLVLLSPSEGEGRDNEMRRAKTAAGKTDGGKEGTAGGRGVETVAEWRCMPA